MDNIPVLLTKFNPSNYFDRFMMHLNTSNPLLIFTSKDDIFKAQQTIDLAKKNDWNLLKQQNITQNDIYNADIIVKALVHPQTQQPLNVFGSFPFFIPFNIPILGGILMTQPTLFNNIFWQWLNQTYNAFFNTTQANKIENNKNEDLSFFQKHQQFIKGYGGAVCVSVGLAVGLNFWLKNSKISKKLKKKLQKIIPYTAVASAGVSNIALMRMNEIKTGIPVFDPNSELIGTSFFAAKIGVTLSAISRAVLPIPSLLFPPFLFSYLNKFPFIQNSRRMKLMCEMLILSLTTALGLPFAAALFPQTFSLPFSFLENDLQNIYINKNKQKIDSFNFNRGL